MLQHLAAITQALAFLNLVKKSDCFTRQIGDELKATAGELPGPTGTVFVVRAFSVIGMGPPCAAYVASQGTVWQSGPSNATKREGTMKAFLRLLMLSTAAGTLLAPASGARAQLLITGNDEKVSFDATGKTVTHPPGKDTVSIIDIREPTKPRIVANLPLMNTITGPPVNLAITPDEHLALVANSLDWVKDGEAWKGVPDNKIYVIDLTVSPPAPDRYARGRQTAFGNGNQPRRNAGAGRQPRR